MKIAARSDILTDAYDALKRGDYRQAMDYYVESIKEGKRESKRSIIVAGQNGLIRTEIISGEAAREDFRLEDTLEASRAIKNRELEGLTLASIGASLVYNSLHIESDSFRDKVQEKAMKAFLDSLSIFQDLAEDKDPKIAKRGKEGKADTQIMFSGMYIETDDYQSALELATAAAKTAKEVNETYLKARAYQRLGFIYYELDKYKEALTNYRLARKFWEDLENLEYEVLSRAGMGEVFLASGKYEKALKQFEAVHDEYKTMKVKSGQASMLNKIGQCYLGMEEYKRAKKYFEKAIILSKKISDRRLTVYNKIGALDCHFLLKKRRFGKKLLMDLLTAEPIKQWPECYNYLHEIVWREDWLREEKKFKEMFEDADPITIEKRLMDEFYQAAKEAYPNEFGAMLKGYPHINDFEVPPDTGRGSTSVTFNLYNRFSQRRIAADGVVHSHPSGSARPSKADLSMFGRFPGINIIIGYPFVEDSWAAYDRAGNRVHVEVVDNPVEE